MVLTYLRYSLYFHCRGTLGTAPHRFPFFTWNGIKLKVTSPRPTWSMNNIHLLSKQGQQSKHRELFTLFSQGTDEIQEQFLQNYFPDVMSALKPFLFLNRELKMCTISPSYSLKSTLSTKPLRRAVRCPKRLIEAANSCKAAHVWRESIRRQSIFPRKRKTQFFLEEICFFSVIE